MTTALAALYLFFGMVFALVVLMVWLRDNVDVEDLDGDDGCLLVIIALVVFVALALFWLPASVAFKISKYVNSSEEAEDEVEE
jgi:hypothetical protein